MWLSIPTGRPTCGLHSFVSSCLYMLFNFLFSYREYEDLLWFYRSKKSLYFFLNKKRDLKVLALNDSTRIVNILSLKHWKSSDFTCHKMSPWGYIVHKTGFPFPATGNSIFLATVLMLILSCRTCSGSKRNLISAFSLAWVLEKNPASTSAPSWVGHVLNGVSFNPWKPVTLSILRPIICEQALNRFNSLLSACSLLSSSFFESGKFLFYCAHT